jgi:hypothetical protein
VAVLASAVAEAEVDSVAIEAVADSVEEAALAVAEVAIEVVSVAEEVAEASVAEEEAVEVSMLQEMQIKEILWPSKETDKSFEQPLYQFN